jgi:ankyrin repeat protein
VPVLVRVGILKYIAANSHMLQQEYFVSDYLRKHSKFSRYAVAEKETELAQNQLATLTLTYLLLDDFSEPRNSKSEHDELFEKYKLYKYCAKNWGDHCGKVNDEGNSVFDLVHSLLFRYPSNLRVLVHFERRERREIHQDGRYSRSVIYDEEPNQGYPVSALSNRRCLELIIFNLRLVIRSVLKKEPDLLNKNLGREGPPLRIAVLYGNEDIARDLIDLGADVHGRWLPYYSTLWYSERITWVGSIGGAYNYSHDVLWRGILDTESWPQPRKDTPFEYPIHAISQYIPKILPLILQHGFDQVNKRDWNGSVPLHRAVLGKSLDAVQALVAAGADINAKTNAGRTSFHIAVSLQMGTIIDYLLGLDAVIPSDITTEELKWVEEEPDEENHNRDLELERNARCRLLQRIQNLPPQQGALPPVLEGWVRTTVSREESVVIMGPLASLEPYVSIAIESKSLKRIVFRLHTNEKGTLSLATSTHHCSAHPSKQQQTVIFQVV